MAKVPVGKGGRGAGGALPEETRAILGATTNAGKAARSGLGGLLANAGDEARGFWQALQTPMGAANLATGFLGRFAVPAQVALEASRDPKALEESPETAIPMAFLRSQTPISLFEQSPGWNQFAQGARQQVTETLTAPGNLLKPGGVGRISKRSAKNLVKMLQGIRQGFYDAPVASTLGMVAPALHMASAHTPAANVADDAGMVAHHGTPHTFAPTEKNPLGEFDLSKMGSGEGRQAYGWGQYLAENPSVAREYRDNLSGQYVLPSGKEIQRLDVWNHVSHKIMDAVPGLPDDVVDFITNDVMSQHDLQGGLKQHRLDETNARRILRLDKDVSRDDILNAYFAADIARGRISKNQGNIYHVDVPDEHVANFLDWDSHGSSQPQAVKRAFNEILGQQMFDEYGRPMPMDLDRPIPDLSGKEIYGWISRQLGSDEAASRYLASKGVFGLKFLDHTSRGAGEGTRNLVIFDPSITTIIARK